MAMPLLHRQVELGPQVRSPVGIRHSPIRVEGGIPRG